MAPSRHDWKIVDRDVKPQHNQPTIFSVYLAERKYHINLSVFFTVKNNSQLHIIKTLVKKSSVVEPFTVQVKKKKNFLFF